MTLRVLGIDPSMTGTGLALIEDGEPLMVETVKLVSVKDDDKGIQLWNRIEKLVNALDGYSELNAIVVERTDWQQSLGKADNWRTAYARERRAQESIGILQGAIAAYVAIESCVNTFMLLGVNEWHREFGAGNKDAVAELLAQEFPRRVFKDKYGGFRFRKNRGDSARMDNNQTDALGIALVGYNRLKQKTMELA